MGVAFSVKLIEPKGGRGWSVLATRGSGRDRRRRRYGRDAGVVDEASAWQAAARIREALADGTWWQPSIDGALHEGDLTLTVAAQRFVDSQARRDRRPGTLRMLTMKLHRFGAWMRDETGSRTLDAFAMLHNIYGEDALYEYVSWMRREKPGGAGLAVATARSYSGTAAQWWTWCARQWRAVVPPAPEVSVTVVRARTMAPTWAQMDQVIAAASAYSEKLYRLLWLMRCLGLRVDQTLQLEWADFDFATKTLDVRGELGKSAAERTGRLVPVAPVLLAEMSGWGVRDGRIVGWRSASYELLHDAIDDAQLPEAIWKRRSSHMFRRGFATGLRVLGAQAWAVERLVGHAVPTGETSVTASYVDGTQLVDVLRETVALVPAVGGQSDQISARRSAR